MVPLGKPTTRLRGSRAGPPGIAGIIPWTTRGTSSMAIWLAPGSTTVPFGPIAMTKSARAVRSSSPRVSAKAGIGVPGIP